MRQTVEVTPATGPLDAVVPVPGSKSLTIRALAAAAMASGESRLLSPLDAVDTRHARSAMAAFGAGIDDSGQDWVVSGTAGRLASPSSPVDVGPSGLTARIVIAMAALVSGSTTVVGTERLPERPMSDLIRALTNLGVWVESADGRIPVTVRGHPPVLGGEVAVDISRSTQFATALALIGPEAQDGLRLVLEGAPGARGYLDLTLQVIAGFGGTAELSSEIFSVAGTGYAPAIFTVEPDASAAVYPLVAVALVGGEVTVPGLGHGSRQPDLRVVEVLGKMGAAVRMGDSETTVTAERGSLQPIDEDLSDCPDGALAIAVACASSGGKCRIRGLSTLRDKESDRLAALSTELTRLGCPTSIDGDDLVVRPGALQPAVVDPHGDHRIAMSLALLGLIAGGIEVAHPEVVDKTWPGYWKMLASLSSRPDPANA